MSVPPPDGWLPLTAAQLGVYFLHQLQPDTPVCSSAELVELPPGLDVERLVAALRSTYAENEQLRVRFRTGPDGPQQQVLDDSADVAVVAVADRSAADAWIDQRLAVPFAIEDGDVVRTAILSVAGEPRWWWHAGHHVVIDGYGFIRFAARVGEHYRGAARPVPQVSVAELVAEDVTRRGLDAVAEEQAFWAGRLADAEGSSSLAGRTAGPVTPVHQVALPLSPQMQSGLVAAASSYGVAWTEVVTAAFAGYLGRLAPADPAKVRLGVSFMDRFAAGRGAWLTAKTICTAMNVLPVCLPAVDVTVGELVAKAAAELAAVRDHVTVRHEDLARELRQRRGAGTALFGPQVNLLPFTTTVDFGVGQGAVRNLTAGPVEDMTWTVRGAVGRGQPVWLEIAGNPELYGHHEIEGTADRLLSWLETFAGSEPTAAVAELPLLSAVEQQHVIEGINATERPDLLATATTLPQAFEAQVAATPEAVALVDEDRSWTYAELGAAVDRLSSTLRRISLPTGAAVGVALPRDARLFVAVHGIVAAGSPYVPLDPELPSRRLGELVVDADVRVVITDAAGWGSSRPA